MDYNESTEAFSKLKISLSASLKNDQELGLVCGIEMYHFKVMNAFITVLGDQLLYLLKNKIKSDPFLKENDFRLEIKIPIDVWLNDELLKNYLQSSATELLRLCIPYQIRLISIEESDLCRISKVVTFSVLKRS